MKIEVASQLPKEKAENTTAAKPKEKEKHGQYSGITATLQAKEKDKEESIASLKEPLEFPNLAKQKPKRAQNKRAQNKAKHGDMLKNVTLNLVDTYTNACPDFKYTLKSAPRRVLTKLSKGVHNQGYDNAEHDYICRVCDKVVNPDNVTYEIEERLGHGTFGQVLKCTTPGGATPIALKIIKNKPAYFHQALVEVHILKMLNDKHDPDDVKRIVRMVDFFVFRKHLCIAFELLSVNLYDVLKQNSFRGVSMALIRVLIEQLLQAMQCLREAYVIHCDLKPENVLLSNMQHTKIKLIDFGSACFEDHTVYSYIQSRFYRSPEVLLGLPYTTAIDMWSLGCICAELFLGLPIFPGHSEYDQVCRIVEVQGLPPLHMLDAGKNTKKFFRRVEEPLPGPSGNDSDRSYSGDEGSLDTSKAYSELGGSFIRGPQQSPQGDKGADEEQQEKQGSKELRSSQSEPAGSPVHDMEQVSRSASDTTAGVHVGESLVIGSTIVQEHTDQKEPKSSKTEEKSESLFEVFKRKVGLHPEQPGQLPTVPAPASSSGCDESGSACVVESEDGSQATGPNMGSNVSTATGTAHGEAGGLYDQEQVLREACLNLREQRRPRRKKRRVRTCWRLKTREEYERDEHKKEPTPKKYFEFKSLEQMVENLPYKSMSHRSKLDEEERRQCFLQLLLGILQMDPDKRWTPLQAVRQSFISGYPYNPEFVPCQDDPVPSLMSLLNKIPKSAVVSLAAGQVPRLSADALGGASEGAAFSGGGSARTWQENEPSNNPTGSSSAPSTFRGAKLPNSNVIEPEKVQAAAGADQTVGGNPTGADGSAKQRKPRVSGSQSSENKGVWGQLVAKVPLPDDNPAESYRPSFDHITQDLMHNPLDNPSSRMARYTGGDQASCSPQKSHGTISSASSAGSTPVQFHSSRGRHDPASPYSTSSPLSVDGRCNLQQQAKRISRHGGIAGTPMSNDSPQPSAGPGSGTPVSTAHTPQGGVPHTAPGAHRACAGSRDGSRGSSPWHLPSPLSELSTASDRVHSSQPSGSDSCGDTLPHHDGGNQCSSGEDPSQSDGHYPRSHQHGHYPRSQSDGHYPHSDSDGTMTPQSHDTAGTNRAEEERGAAKDPRELLWENIKSEMARVELSRDRLPRRSGDNTQSPGSAGAMGNFREKMGMNDSGPVIPFGPGTRRDGNTASQGHSTQVNFSPLYRSEPSQTGQRQKNKKHSGGHGTTSGSGTPGNSTQ
jgi:serine/threonine protein kinase